jgi:hypothetical protein
MATLPSRLLGAVHYVVRAEARLPALFRARIERAGEPPMRVSLRNVSRSGFMAVVPESLAVGSELTLVLPIGAPVRANVRWGFGDRVGCSLQGQFVGAQLALLIAGGTVNALASAAGLRFIVVAACAAMYLLT